MKLRDSKIDVMEKFQLNGKVAVVTGGAGMLGSLYCWGLVEAGARVIIADLKQDACEELANKINNDFPDKAIALAVDLAKEDSVKDWVIKIEQIVGNVDIIVNNAATKSKKLFCNA